MRGKATDKFHVVAVNVAAALAKVSELADSVSMEAMNAKVLVSRSGRKALGFQPITDFMAEMSQKVMMLVSEVNSGVVIVSNLSTQNARHIRFMKQLTKALNLTAGAIYQADIIEQEEAAKQTHKQLEYSLDEATRLLISNLDEILVNMQAAFIMSSTARIETAALTLANQDSFYSVSDKLEKAAQDIRIDVIKDGLVIGYINKTPTEYVFNNYVELCLTSEDAKSIADKLRELNKK